MQADYGDDYTRYQSDRGFLRRLVRAAYLRAAAGRVCGPTLDFGCGVGELLKRLPAGSRGVEYNRASVAYCKARGLSVEWYDGYADGWSLSALPSDWQFESMVVSHVLEHLDDPVQVLRALLAAAPARGIDRVLVIVPGLSGFHADDTHRTFVDLQMLREAVGGTGGWGITSSRYFPGNFRRLGDSFPHHELQVVVTKPLTRPDQGT